MMGLQGFCTYVMESDARVTTDIQWAQNTTEMYLKNGLDGGDFGWENSVWILN